MSKSTGRLAGKGEAGVWGYFWLSIASTTYIGYGGISQGRKVIKNAVFSIFANQHPPPEDEVYDMQKCYHCQYIF